jgi:heme exporter protein B
LRIEKSARPAALSPRPAPLWRAAWAIFLKDLRLELRTRYALNALLLFAVSTVFAISLGVGPLSIALNSDLPLIQAALLWLAILFAALSGLARAFVQEEEARTAAALRLAAPPQAVFLGKLLFNWALLLALDVVVVLLFLIFVRADVADPTLLALTVFAGSTALAASTTIIAALVAQARVKGALFTVLALPLLVPLLVLAIRASHVAFVGAGWARAASPLQAIVGYGVAMFVASLMLFDAVWSA